MIRFHGIPYGTAHWHKFRENGIGGSEVSTLLDLNPYGNRAKMFYEKIGMIEPFKVDNEAMFHGRGLQGYILNLWQYWDGSDTGYINNANEGKIQRNYRCIDGYVTNDKYPYLFSSLDGIICKEGFRLDTGEILSDEGVLEAKTINGYEANKWVGGIPKGYIAQVTQYYIVFEKTYGEIAILKDGRNFSVISIPYSEVFADIVKRTAYEFWDKLVLPAKEYKLKMDEAIKRGSQKDEERWLAEILALEPSPSPGDSYKEFIINRYEKEKEETRGNIRTFALARKDLAYRELINKLTAERSLVQNQLIKEFVDNRTEFIRFEEEGYMRFFTKKGGQTPQLDNRIRGKADEQLIEDVINKINLNILK